MSIKNSIGKGKTLSKIGKGVSIVFVVCTFFFLPERDVDSIIKIGVFIIAVFAPIDISIWVDTFFKGKNAAQGSTSEKQHITG